MTWGWLERFLVALAYEAWLEGPSVFVPGPELDDSCAVARWLGYHAIDVAAARAVRFFLVPS